MSSSAKKLTFQAILIMFFSNFLSRIIGFVRTVIFGNLVATGADADAYVFSFLIPDFLNHFLAGSALSIAFIPIFQKLQEDTDEEQKWRFFSNLFWVGTALFLIFVLISELCTPQLVQLLGGKNLEASSEVFDLTVRLTRIIIPAQLFFFWGALFNGVQYANKKFFLPSLTPVAYNIFIIAFGVILYQIIGVEGFSWGVLAGAFVGNVVIQLIGLRKCGAKLTWNINLKDAQLKEWFIKTFPLMLGFSAVFSNEFMYRKFGASSIDGKGAISALNYAYMIFMVMVGLFGQSIATGVFPFLSKLANEKKIKEMEDLLFPVIYKVAALLLTSSVVLFFLAEDVISIIFERKNFDTDSVAITTRAFLGFLPGAFFLASVLILNRLYYSTKRTITPLVISTITLACVFPLYFLLDKVWGVRGISTASSLYAFLCFFALLFYWKKLNKDSQVFNLLRKLVIIFIASMCIGGATYGVLQIPALSVRSEAVQFIDVAPPVKEIIDSAKSESDPLLSKEEIIDSEKGGEDRSGSLDTNPIFKRYLRVIVVGFFIGLLSLFVFDRMQIVSISAILKKIRRQK